MTSYEMGFIDGQLARRGANQHQEIPTDAELRFFIDFDGGIESKEEQDEYLRGYHTGWKKSSGSRKTFGVNNDLTEEQARKESLL